MRGGLGQFVGRNAKRGRGGGDYLPTMAGASDQIQPKNHIGRTQAGELQSGRGLWMITLGYDISL